MHHAIPPHVALGLLNAGLTVSEAARELGVSRQTAYRMLAEARRSGALDRPPSPWGYLVIMPGGLYTPESKCNHDVEPIPPGRAEYCPLCHRTGFDHLRSFANVRPLPLDPKPKHGDGLAGGKMSPKRRAVAERDWTALKLACGKLTRRDRRRLAHLSREAALARRVLAKDG